MASATRSPGLPRLGQGWWPSERAAQLLLAAALTVGVLIPLTLSIVTGSISIPHNDAWSHAVIASTFAETGRIELVGWNRSSLVGQIVVLGPLAGSVVLQHLWVAAMAAVGLLATHRLVAARTNETGGATVALVVACAPQFGLLATSYMTDVPAYAAVVLSLTLADTALASGRLGVLALSLAVGLWGVTIREQALVAPAAVALSALWLLRGRARRIAGIQVAAASVLFGAFEVWRRSLPNGDPPRIAWSLVEAGTGAAGALMALGLCAAPLVLSCRPPKAPRWILVLTAVVVAGLGAAWVNLSRSASIAGNYVTNFGAYPEASPAPRIIMPDALWYAVLAMAVLSVSWLTAITLGAILTRPDGHPDHRSTDPLIPLTLAFLLAGTVLQAAIGQMVFGRYLLPAVPLVAILLRPHWIRLTVVGWVGLALNAGMGLVLTADALARDAALWRAAEAQVAAGVESDTINAGLAWVGTHAELPARSGLADREGSALPRIMGMFPESSECYVITANPGLDLPIADEIQYRRWALTGSGVMYVYEQNPCR